MKDWKPGEQERCEAILEEIYEKLHLLVNYIALNKRRELLNARIKRLEQKMRSRFQVIHSASHRELL